MDNFKHKLYMARNLWERGTTPFPIVYFMPIRKDYIQMSLFPGTPKSQNWDFCYPKTLDIHIFLKSSFFFENLKAISYSPQKDLSNGV